MKNAINKHKAPITYIFGDFNAKIIGKTEEEESSATLGNHFMETNQRVSELTENQRENRELLMNLCETEKLIVANTNFQKPSEKNAHSKNGIDR